MQSVFRVRNLTMCILKCAFEIQLKQKKNQLKWWHLFTKNFFSLKKKKSLLFFCVLLYTVIKLPLRLLYCQYSITQRTECFQCNEVESTLNTALAE